MNSLAKQRSSSSEAKFILVRGGTKEQEPIRWNWLTQRRRDESEVVFAPRLTYSEKKSILTQLPQKQRAVSSSFKIRQGFVRKQKARILSTATCSSSKLQRKSKQPFIYINSNEEQLNIPNFNFDQFKDQLISRIASTSQTGRSVFVVFSARRMGLRYKLFHAFVDYCDCNKISHGHDLSQISQQVREQIKVFSRIDKELYYFHLNRSPLHSYQDLRQHKPTLLLVDCVPKLNFSKQLLLRILQQAERIEDILQAANSAKNKLEYKNMMKEMEGDEKVYDWQRIDSVKNYVDRISEDPLRNMLKARVEKKSELISWYNQKFHEESNSGKSNKQTKNPLFESKSHYPNQIINKKLLSRANQSVETLPMTQNKHKFIPNRLDIMMEQIRREGGVRQVKQQAFNSIYDTATSKKDLLHYLDKKNSLLITQNIPYLIEKYGLNRFQIYNLYNLYKSFEKVSLLRNPNGQKLQEVLAKGVDRQTFEVGLKGLDMNPGQELIRNICYFGDFINWQQFIKIISISLRKTPEEKLTAILKGISSFDDGFLSRHQISLMIGNSLQKLFDKEQIQMRDYFTNMAMKELDAEGTGKVSVERMKQKILGKGSESLTMVSFLILNT